MEIDTWISCYKVRAFPWIDGKTIYVNIQCFRPGQSVEQPPAWDKTIYLTDNANGKKILKEYLNSFVNYLATFPNTDDKKFVITA